MTLFAIQQKLINERNRIRCLLASMRPATPADVTLDVVEVLPTVACDECEGSGEVRLFGRDASGLEDTWEPCSCCRDGLVLDPEFANDLQWNYYLTTGDRAFPVTHPNL